MNEKKIIDGTRNRALSAVILIPSIVLLLSALVFILRLVTEGSPWPYVWYTDPKFRTAIGLFVASALFFLPFCILSRSQITVTDKRVFGRTAFGKRVDLPIDMISSVGTSFFGGVNVATSSGSVKFDLIENNSEVHAEISKLLLERQGNASATTVIKQEIPQSNADELKKYKDLLDASVISQSEFEAKKKQLLGL